MKHLIVFLNSGITFVLIASGKSQGVVYIFTKSNI